MRLYLNPKLTIHYVNEREGEETTVDYHEPEGICAYVKKLNEGKQMLHEPVYFKRMIDGIEAEVAFQYTEDFGRIFWDFVITFIRSKVEHISQGLRRNSLRS